MATVTNTRPSPRQISKSFSRLDSPSSDDRVRSRSSTLSTNGQDTSFLSSPVVASPDKEEEDIFSKQDDNMSTTSALSGSQLNPPQTFDELPIEIRSLTERFLESLSARVHPTPLTVDALADMFQDFYRKAESHIATHIAALSSRLSRRTISKGPKKPGQEAEDQQMLTASEISNRKKARRLLEQKKTALEEAVERAVCERIYEKLWHHRNSEDAEGDQKLRSRVAALSLVGIGLKELLVSGAEDVSEDVRKKTVEQEDKIRESLGPARASIQEMTLEKYPLGKLHHLTSAHKSIVETLSTFFPSSSSADEILPTLIYTLLTTPPDTINVVSDLRFIQRFRSSGRIDGEAAYCLVNLEAAISFLETVELPSLRADEALQGPDKAPSMPGTPRKINAVPMQLGITPVSDPSNQLEPFPNLVPGADVAAAGTKSDPPAARSPRRLSNLIQAQTNRLEAAGENLRGAVLESADQALDTINSTIENSFRFLFGRIRAEQQTTTEGSGDVPVPKTLEEARKLVSTPPPTLDEEGSLPDSSPPNGKIPEEASLGDRPLASNKSSDSLATSRVLDLVGGRRPLRDRSVDSAASGSSGGKRVSFIENSKGLPPLPASVSERQPSSSPARPLPSPAPSNENLLSSSPAASSPLAAGNAAVESMRNLGNSLNPLNQFAKIGFFGRSVSVSGSSSMPPPPLPPTSSPNSLPIVPTVASLGARSPAEFKAQAVVEELKKLTPPAKKFLDCKDVKELRLGEVEELLVEYKRLAAAFGKAVAP